MLNMDSSQYINSILNNRSENKYYKNQVNSNSIDKNLNNNTNNKNNIERNSISFIHNIYNNENNFKLDNNFSYKKEYYNNTISSNHYNNKKNQYNRSKYTIINKRHIDHNKTVPIYNTETQPTINPILKRPITIQDIIIKNNLQIKEYNNALIEKKINDVRETHNKAWDMNFSILSNKKSCNSC